jgi:hypothetical protein
VRYCVTEQGLDCRESTVIFAADVELFHCVILAGFPFIVIDSENDSVVTTGPLYGRLVAVTVVRLPQAVY